MQKPSPPFHVHIKDPNSHKFMEIIVDSDKKLRQFREKLVECNAWFVVSGTYSAEETLLIETIK